MFRHKASPGIPFWSVERLVGCALQRDLAEEGTSLRGRLLDLGCGNSPYRALLTCISDYIGYDLDITASKPMVAGAADRLPFAAGSFDSVLCTQVLEHVPEPWRVLEEIARVLRPGGKLLLSAPQAWRLHEQPRDYYRYTRYGLDYLLRRAGLHPMTCRSQGGVWLHVGQSVSNTLWNPAHRRFSPAWFISRTLAMSFGTLVNLAIPVFDRLFYDAEDTSNYVILAERAVSGKQNHA